MKDDPSSGASKYKKLEKVGEGTYGLVYRAVAKASGEVVAFKKVKLDAHDEGLPGTMIREVALLKNLTHPNIVECVEARGGAGRGRGRG